MIPLILFIIIQRWPPKITKHNPTRPNLDSSTYWGSSQHVPPHLWCPWPRWHHGPWLQLNSTKPKQTQPNLTTPNQTQLNPNNKFNYPTKINPTKTKPTENPIKSNQTQSNLNKPNQTESNPTKSIQAQSIKSITTYLNYFMLYLHKNYRITIRK